jgi:dihydroflavonol-4-reductase
MRRRSTECRRTLRHLPFLRELLDESRATDPNPRLVAMPATPAQARGRTALVTGASGHVGVNLVRRLSDQGWHVRTFSRRRFEAPGLADTEHVSGDVCDPSATARAVQGVDVVFNLAAKIALHTRDDEAWAINARGPVIVARSALAAGVERIIHCSSVQAFDVERSQPRLDENSPRPGPHRPLYDRSKAAGEAGLRAVITEGLDAVIVNPTGIIGPIDLGSSRANAMLRAAARGHLPIALAGGSDWVDVRDVVDGLIAAVDHGRSGENYLLSGHPATVIEIGRLAAGINGRIGPLVGLPGSLSRRVAPVGEWIGRGWGSDVFTPASIDSLLNHPLVDHAKATRELRYRPRPLVDTVRDLVTWLGQDGQLDRSRWAWATLRRPRRASSGKALASGGPIAKSEVPVQPGTAAS